MVGDHAGIPKVGPARFEKETVFTLDDSFVYELVAWRGGLVFVEPRSVANRRRRSV